MWRQPVAEYQFPGQPAKLDRKVIITWPASRNGALRPACVTITDAETGEPISTVSKAVLEVHLDADTSLTWAAVKAFANPDGTLLADTSAKLISTEPDGSVRTRVFAFEVTEMRVAAPATMVGGAGGHE
jgi:hypothetical protein